MIIFPLRISQAEEYCACTLGTTVEGARSTLWRRGRRPALRFSRESSTAAAAADQFPESSAREVAAAAGRVRTHARVQSRTGGGVPTAAAAVFCAHSADSSERQRRRRRYRYAVRPHATRWVPSKTSERPRHTSVAGAGDKTDAKKTTKRIKKKTKPRVVVYPGQIIYLSSTRAFSIVAVRDGQNYRSACIHPHTIMGVVSRHVSCVRRTLCDVKFR